MGKTLHFAGKTLVFPEGGVLFWVRPDFVQEEGDFVWERPDLFSEEPDLDSEDGDLL